MSDKPSDKKYRITLTRKQLNLVVAAIEMMMSSGRGQMYNLAEWLTLAGDDYPTGSDFCLWVTERNVIESTLEGIMRNEKAHRKVESDDLRELTTLSEAFRHQQWKDSGEPEWGVGHSRLMRCGEEPIPRIEVIKE